MIEQSTVHLPELLKDIDRPVSMYLLCTYLVRYTDNPHHRRAKLITMTSKGSTSTRLYAETAGSMG